MRCRRSNRSPCDARLDALGARLSASIPDRALPVLPQHVVERFRHKRLQTATLPPGQRVHGEGHLGAEEASDLLAALAASGDYRLAGNRCCDESVRDRYGRRAAQVGEAGFAAHATAFFANLRETGRSTCRHIHM